jgi:hypothetical protein
MPANTVVELRSLNRDYYVVDATSTIYHSVKGLYHLPQADDWILFQGNGYLYPYALEVTTVPNNHQAKNSLYNIKGRWYTSRQADDVPDNVQYHIQLTDLPYGQIDQDTSTWHLRTNFNEISVQHDAYPNIPTDFCEHPELYQLLAWNPSRRAFYKFTFEDVICALTVQVAQSGGFNLTTQTTGDTLALQSDLNGDGQVSTADLLEFLTAFGSEQEVEPYFLYHRHYIMTPDADVSGNNNATSTSLELFNVPVGGSISADYIRENWETVFTSPYREVFPTSMDILSDQLYDSYGAVTVAKVDPSDPNSDYDFDHILFQQPNFQIPVANGPFEFAVTNRAVAIRAAIDFQRSIEKHDAFWVGYKIEKKLTNGDIENYYQLGLITVLPSAGTEGTATDIGDNTFWLDGVQSGTQFKQTDDMQEWRLFVAVRAAGTEADPFNFGGGVQSFSSDYVNSLKISGVSIYV